MFEIRSEIIISSILQEVNECGLQTSLISIASPEYEALLNSIISTLERPPIKIEINLFKLQTMVIELYKKLPSLAPNLESLCESSCFRAIEEESDRWGRQLKARLLVWSQRLRESEEWTEYVSHSGCTHIQF